MSKALLESFFPTLSRALQHGVPRLYGTLLLSDATAQACPVVVMVLDGAEIRWPGLLMAAMLGVVVGFGGAMCLLFGGGPTREGKDGLWAFACVSFGCMNVDAIFYHCLLDPGSPTHQFLFAADCCFTGMSSMALVAASLDLANRSRGIELISRRDLSRPCWVLVCTSALVFWAVGPVLALHGRPLVCELIYMLPTAAGGACLGGFFVARPLAAGRPDLVSPWLRTGAAMVSVSLLSIIADAKICELLGPTFGNIPVWIFLGCDLAFLAIVLWRLHDRPHLPPWLRRLQLAYDEELVFYRGFHQHPLNVAIHGVCVPAECWAYNTMASLLPLLRLHWVAACLTAGYYLLLRPAPSLAVFAAALSQLAFAASADTAKQRLGHLYVFGLAVLVQGLAWTLQVGVGHKLIEKNAPGLQTRLTLNSVVLSHLLAWDHAPTSVESDRRTRRGHPNKAD